MQSQGWREREAQGIDQRCEVGFPRMAVQTLAGQLVSGVG